MKTIETLCYDYFTERFEGNLYDRFEKLKEEFEELKEAFEDYFNAKYPSDRKIKEEHLLEEIGDVQAVLTHITTILGSDFQTVVMEAIIKNKVRETNPNYKR